MKFVLSHIHLVSLALALWIPPPFLDVKAKALDRAFFVMKLKDGKKKKIIVYYFTLFSALSLKFDIDFMLCLNLDAVFSLQIIHLCLDFIKFPVEKIDSFNHVVPNIPKNFPVTDKG